MIELEENALTEQIIGAAIEVHRHFGPGLLEHTYETFLAHELKLRGIPFERQCPIIGEYKGETVDCAYRADLFVDKKVIVELKAISKLNELHEAQISTYLKLANCRVGLLMNFNVRRLKDGIRRVIFI